MRINNHHLLRLYCLTLPISLMGMFAPDVEAQTEPEVVDVDVSAESREQLAAAAFHSEGVTGTEQPANQALTEANGHVQRRSGQRLLTAGLSTLGVAYAVTIAVPTLLFAANAGTYGSALTFIPIAGPAITGTLYALGDRAHSQGVAFLGWLSSLIQTTALVITIVGAVRRRREGVTITPFADRHTIGLAAMGRF